MADDDDDGYRIVQKKNQDWWWVMACCAFRPRRRIAAPNRVRTRPHAAAARASSSDEEVFHDAAETFLTAGNAEEALALPPHPAAWDRAREGFLGYLTPKQEEKLAKMRAMVTQDLELEKCGPSTQWRVLCTTARS